MPKTVNVAPMTTAMMAISWRMVSMGAPEREGKEMKETRKGRRLQANSALLSFLSILSFY
jgi:hypothetical protein